MSGISSVRVISIPRSFNSRSFSCGKPSNSGFSFERFSTTVLNAYLQPLMDAYLAGLEERLLDLGLRPRSLEVTTLPLLGILSQHIAQTGYRHAVAVCEIERDQTRVYIIAKDGIHTLLPLPGMAPNTFSNACCGGSACPCNGGTTSASANRGGNSSACTLDSACPSGIAACNCSHWLTTSAS